MTLRKSSHHSKMFHASRKSILTVDVNIYSLQERKILVHAKKGGGDERLVWKPFKTILLDTMFRRKIDQQLASMF